jgi:hypothetical protein
VHNISQSYYGKDGIDVTGPRRFAKAFISYFSGNEKYKDPVSQILKTVKHNFMHIPFEEGNYGFGVRLIRRMVIWDQCLISTIEDNDGTILLYNKYPRYYEDMLWYSNKPHYDPIWKQRKVFNG